ncbi:hypothetical protein [Granulicella tundricola]|uniref:PBS lyase HEAT domain protein repeat-containing protein n=1 Tax=Granulicella tundricola (strain ATCC BAA-1859 / DSM 23138 / MP5ACTX9) TaxID=1198114 RepID=E8WXL6_GRATM|nr:hypothetical protein [Granulicella tundricola]ADW68632.1 hypothetical protein AciX9_1579 [Granulicella tundricola MP5ACTX9]
MLLKSFLFCAFAMMGAGSGLAQQDMEHMVLKVGGVYYFGYGGVDLSKLRALLPLHAGDNFSYATFDEDEAAAAVTHVTGKPPTDISEVCCDEAKKVTFYVGLAGTTSRTLPSNVPPTGADHVAPEALALYDAEMTALGLAMAAGRNGEDDSQGYTLLNDPASHAINLKMRAYAVGREAEITRVLEHASNVKQRQVAAALLGYVQRSSTQVSALERAILDADGGTRNNAVRALAVLAAAQDATPFEIDPNPLIALLYSGKWTDRNKASALLSRITEKENPALLRALRQQALPVLIEGASWDEGHGIAFVLILGRVLGVTPGSVKEMIAAGTCCGERR